MKSQIIGLFLLALCTASLAAAKEPIEPQAGPSAFEKLTAEFGTEINALQLPELSLSWEENLQRLGGVGELQRQQKVFRKYVKSLRQIDPANLPICQRIDHAIMSNESRLGAKRAELGLTWASLGPRALAPRDLSDFAMGLTWYQYFLERWNGGEIDIFELYTFGERALQASVAAYDAALLEPAGPNPDPDFMEGGAPARTLFQKRQQTVRQNLPNVFPEAYGIPLVKIKHAPKGEALPVPGYYREDIQTFFYHVSEDGYDVRQADWLFLHEGTPGHHFQMSASAALRRCPNHFPNLFHPAFVEGWGAYAETLGEELGLYQSKEAKLAALEWDMVRSARVVLDVGLNAYAWNDEQALRYWHKNVRGQRDIAQREIDRMRRWPAQAITYKFGSDIFLRLQGKFTQGPHPVMSLQRFHHTIFAHGPMPMPALEANFIAMIDGY
jgi:hypothetical protein